jgi:hypothetical protein
MPCDMKLYPADWQQIRARILSRAGNRCEQCGVVNHAVGHRKDDGSFVADDSGPHGEGLTWDGEPLSFKSAQSLVNAYNTNGLKRKTDEDGNRWIVIVLTIAHVDDPNPNACDDSNLRAWCQRCHNRHDMPMRKQNAKRTMMQRKAVGSLFTDVPAAS